MAYITQTEISDAFGETELIDLADRDGDGFVDAPVVALAIGRAAGVIDSYLRSRFTLPLATTPQLVRECALAIVRYLLAEDHATDRVVKDYERALKWLGEIRDGKLDVGLDPASAAPAITGGGAQISGGRPVFDRDKLDAWSGSEG